MKNAQSIAKPMLKALRVQRGWSQAELARRAGLSQATVAKIEVHCNYKKPIKLQTAILVSRALGLDVNDVNWQCELSLTACGFEPGEAQGPRKSSEALRPACCATCFTALPGTGKCDYCS